MTDLSSKNKKGNKYVLYYSLTKNGPGTSENGVECWTRNISFLARDDKKARTRKKQELGRLRRKYNKTNDPDHPHDPGATWVINEVSLYRVVPKK